MAVHFNIYKIEKMGITDALDHIHEDEPLWNDSERETMNEHKSEIFDMVSGTTFRRSGNVSS